MDLQTLRCKVDARLSELVPQIKSSEKALYEAARYSLLAPGKRLRPLLTLATAESLGTPIEAALDPACAIEMIHCYSMIHDDLPSMDNDDFRRGRPTLHKVYNEAHAILTGDYLLTKAFEVIALTNLSDSLKCQIIALIAHHSGGPGMIGGQVLDIAAEQTPITEELLREIHRKKTGALILASILTGAICAGASQEQLTQFKRVGSSFGLGFQILDDVLDITNSQEKHGKSESSDAINGKVTFATLYGVDKASQMAKEQFSTAKQTLENLSKSPSLLLEILNLIHSPSKN